MSYTALYRRFRPQTFDEVKGQEPIVTTLKNQIKNGRMSHAYLFTGTRGTGKTSIAKIFAKAVNCENPVDGSPCGQCPMCRSIQEGSSMNVIEMDAASNNGVDAVRVIVDEVSYSPTAGKYKVYIIDEVHMMSTAAFNALLKTLEEPPSYVIFILATTEVHKLPITILSRCQRYDFRRISIDSISDRIVELTTAEGVELEDRAVKFIAKTADGSMRDALSLLDQCIAFFFDQKLTYDKVLDVLGAVDTEVFSRMLRAVIASDVPLALKILEEIVYQGRDLGQFVTDMTWYLRNLLLIKTAEANEDIIDMSSENMAKLKEEAQLVSHEIIMRYIRILSELSGQIKYASQKRIMIEVALIKLCRPQMETDNDSLSDRIRLIEDKIENGLVVSSAASESISLSEGNQNKKHEMSDDEKAALVKALPEDVRNVVAQWGQVVSECEEMIRQYLSDSYPSVKGNDTLAIVFAERYAYQRFSEADRKEELRMNISSVVGKDINISVEFGGDDGSSGMFPDLRKYVEERIDFHIDDIDSEDADAEDEEVDEFDNYDEDN